MAVRERKGRKSPWQAYWNNPFTGKRECANFATKEEALKEDSLIKHRLKFERESFRPEQEGEKQEGTQELTLAQAFFLYLQEKQFNIRSLEPQMIAMRIPLLLYGDQPLVAIGKNELLRIIAEVQKQPIKQTTCRRRLSVLKAVLRWSHAHDFCGPVAFPALANGTHEKFIPPSPVEIEAMLAAAPPHLQRVILLGSQFGIRIGTSELFKLTWRDVDFELGIIRINAANKNPSAPWREVPIRQSLLSQLQQWHAEDMAQDIPLVVHFNGKPIGSVKSAWGSMLRRAGINRRIRPYDLRHAFATELIAQGVDIGTVAKLMGHSSPNMIFQHYQVVMDKQKRAAVESLPEYAYVPKKMCPNKKGAAEI